MPDISATGSHNASTQSIDARGLKCPLPVLHTRRALSRLTGGQRLEVFCTDPVSVIDIPNLVREMNASLERTEDRGGEYLFVIVAGGRS